MTRRFTILVVVAVIAATIVVLAIRLSDSNTAVRALEHANASQAASIAHDKRVLGELCLTNSIVAGLVQQSIDLFRGELRLGLVPSRARFIYLDALVTFDGYKSLLDNMTSCTNVGHP